jgi:hypothetical protein
LSFNLFQKEGIPSAEIGGFEFSLANSTQIAKAILEIVPFIWLAVRSQTLPHTSVGEGQRQAE